MASTLAPVPPPTSATRMVAGVELPAVGTWAIDPEHAFVGFAGRRFDMATVHGRFATVSGAVHIAEDPAGSWVEAAVATGSLESGSAERDRALRAAEHLDVERHPLARFRSTGVLWRGRSREARVAGQLTIVGVTTPVELDVTYHGTVVDPRGTQRSGFTASATLDREDWGLSWNVTLQGGGALVSRYIRLDIDIETTRRPERSITGRR